LYFREHPEDQIDEKLSYLKLHSTGIILKLNQSDNYNLTWKRLSGDLFRFVTSDFNLKSDIVPLLCVCKKMTIKVLRELFYITGCYPSVYLCKSSCPWIKLKRSPSFDLYPLSISYISSLWRIFKNSFPIHCLIINFTYQMVSSEPLSTQRDLSTQWDLELEPLSTQRDLSTQWDLSSLNRLVINMSTRFDQDNQISMYDDDGYPWTDKSFVKNPFNQYQLPSLKEMVLFNTKITPEILKHLNPNLESIELANCQLEPPWYINLRKFKYLKKFTILLEQNTCPSSEPCLDLTKYTIEFPGISKRLKFKDDRVLKVL
jgi:hypothetical protein